MHVCMMRDVRCICMPFIYEVVGVQYLLFLVTARIGFQNPCKIPYRYAFNALQLFSLGISFSDFIHFFT